MRRLFSGVSKSNLKQHSTATLQLDYHGNNNYRYVIHKMRWMTKKTQVTHHWVFNKFHFDHSTDQRTKIARKNLNFTYRRGFTEQSAKHGNEPPNTIRGRAVGSAGPIGNAKTIPKFIRRSTPLLSISASSILKKKKTIFIFWNLD